MVPMRYQAGKLAATLRNGLASVCECRGLLRRHVDDPRPVRHQPLEVRFLEHVVHCLSPLGESLAHRDIPADISSFLRQYAEKGCRNSLRVRPKVPAIPNLDGDIASVLTNPCNVE